MFNPALSKLFSRKLLVTVLSVGALVASGNYHEAVMVAMTYLLGQSAVDAVEIIKKPK